MINFISPRIMLLVGCLLGGVLLADSAAQPSRRPGLRRRPAVETAAATTRGASHESEILQAAAVVPQGPLAPAVARLQQAREALDSVHDYTCRFSKREVVGRQLISQAMSMKLRREPFSVYMRYEGAEKGREVLYVDGRNGNRLLVHETNVALVGNVTLPLAINAPEILRENRHPITNVGLHKLTDIVLLQFVRESDASDARLEEFPSARLAGRTCHAFRLTCDQPQPGRTFHQTVCYFDAETGMLVRVEQYGFPRRPGEKPMLVEEYTYTQIEPNVGLSETDFDPRNREYRFQ